MTSIGTYGLVNAKVRAMRSFLLTTALYRSMIEAQSFRELLNVLSKTDYQKLIKQLESSDPLAIERILLTEEIHRLQKIARISKNDPHQMVQLFIEKYDVEKLKTLLRLWHKKGEKNTKIYEKKIVYDLPVDAILSAKDAGEIVLLLEGTPFQKTLEKHIAEYNEQKTVFPLELALDKDYYSRLWHTATKLNRRDRRIAQRLFGIEIDLKNLDWINRFRTYYDTPSSEIESYLLPHGYRLGSKEFQTVFGGGNVSKILIKIIDGSDLSLPEELGENTVSQIIEHFLYQVLAVEAKRAFSEFPFSIGAILGFMVLQRIESKNLKTLIYAKSYNLPPDKIEDHLVL
ncbi:V-type ATPase subunit [bacterium]|nr:V-type ATPase subunit [bacterium]RQV96307.1 MAG: hypothetical protein EH221_04880 [bacterium]